MADSIRQQIVSAIDARFGTISTTAGYESNIGSNVYLWRSEPLDDSLIPCILWRDTTETIEQLTIGTHQHSINCDVEIIASGANSVSLIRKMISDVVECIGTDLTWGGLAEDTLPVTNNDITIDQKENTITGAKVSFVVQFTTNPFDPYN